MSIEAEPGLPDEVQLAILDRVAVRGVGEDVVDGGGGEGGKVGGGLGGDEKG